MKKESGNRIPGLVITLGLVSLFTDAASEMIYPLVPVYITLLGSGAVILGIIEGLAETTSALLKLISGIISDKTGKRKMLVLAGYTLSSMVRPLTGAVTAAWQIILIRTSDRVGKGLRTAPRDALIASASDEKIRGKAYGFDRAMDHIGAVIGPVLAIITLLTVFLCFGIRDPLLGLRWTFFVAVIPGILAILTIIFFVRKDSPAVRKVHALKLSLNNFDRNFRNYLLIMVLFTLGNSSDAFLLFRVEETIRKSGAVATMVKGVMPLHRMISAFGSTEMQNTFINILFLPLIWAFFHVIKAIFSTPLGALSDRIGRKKVINFGWGIYSFVYLSFAVIVFIPPAGQIWVTFILFAIYAFFYSFSEGAEKAFVADLATEENRGTAFGLFNFSVGLGTLPASIIFGILYSSFERLIPGYGGTVAFGFGGLIALLSMLLLGFCVKEPVRRQ